LLVAWRAKAKVNSSAGMPAPLSVILIEVSPPSAISTVTKEAPASMAFSVSSFTTDRGRSTTSPAAILSIKRCSSCMIGFMENSIHFLYKNGNTGSKGVVYMKHAANAELAKMATEIPTVNANASTVVGLVKEGGHITGYQLSNGQTVDKAQGVALARSGGIAGVGISERNGSEYLKSIPDGTEDNNFSHLPSVTG
jgi:hypothetical protein